MRPVVLIFALALLPPASADAAAPASPPRAYVVADAATVLTWASDDINVVAYRVYGVQPDGGLALLGEVPVVPGEPVSAHVLPGAPYAKYALTALREGAEDPPAPSEGPECIIVTVNPPAAGLGDCGGWAPTPPEAKAGGKALASL